MSGAGAAQPALRFGFRDADGAADFLVGPANRDAAAWIDRWPDWPAPGLALYGPPGCGKSHLLAIWARRAAARTVAGRALGAALPGLLAGEARAVAVDDAEAALGDEARERALVHLCNAVAARRGAVLLAAATPPASWRTGLADLRSRAAALPAAAIAEPDDDLLAAVLVKLFADRQTIVGAAAIDYLVGRIERSFAAARRVADAVDRAACERRRAVTVPFVRGLLMSGEA